MGIQDWAGPETGPWDSPTHCIERLPPLPPEGGKGTTRQEKPAYR